MRYSIYTITFSDFIWIWLKNMPKDLHLHNSFAFWINRLSNILQDSFNQQLKSYDITWPQWLILNILHNQMASTPALLAENMGVDRSGVTRLLDRLEAKGYVEREHDKLDRRSVKIHLTQKGQNIMADINQAAYDHQQAFLEENFESMAASRLARLQCTFITSLIKYEKKPERLFLIILRYLIIPSVTSGCPMVLVASTKVRR